MLPLNQIVKEYLERNGIRHIFFAEYIGCKSKTRLSNWLNQGGERLNKQELRRTHDFLSGKYLVTVDEIIGDSTNENDTVQ